MKHFKEPKVMATIIFISLSVFAAWASYKIALRRIARATENYNLKHEVATCDEGVMPVDYSLFSGLIGGGALGVFSFLCMFSLFCVIYSNL